MKKECVAACFAIFKQMLKTLVDVKTHMCRMRMNIAACKKYVSLLADFGVCLPRFCRDCLVASFGQGPAAVVCLPVETMIGAPPRSRSRFRTGNSNLWRGGFYQSLSWQNAWAGRFAWRLRVRKGMQDLVISGNVGEPGWARQAWRARRVRRARQAPVVVLVARIPRRTRCVKPHCPRTSRMQHWGQ